MFLRCYKRRDYCLQCTVTKYNLGLKIYTSDQPFVEIIEICTNIVEDEIHNFRKEMDHLCFRGKYPVTYGWYTELNFTGSNLVLIAHTKFLTSSHGSALDRHRTANEIILMSGFR